LEIRGGSPNFRADRSGFVAKHGNDFLEANQKTFLGLNMKRGPDGGVYVIDWHDKVICGFDVKHGDTGRFYRITSGDVISRRI